MKITAQFDYLYTGESNSRELYLERDEKYADKSICLGFVTPLGRLYITDSVEFTENSCEYLIPEGLLDGRGKLFVQLIALDGEEYVAKSRLYEYPVLASVDDMTLPEATADGVKSIAVLFELLKTKADEGHIHDGRYYTEEETDALLSGKSNISHLHGGIYLTREEIEELVSDVSADSHHHDGRYYTETEADSLLSGKSDISHTHDGRYYTESETDSLLSGKSNTSHTHSYSSLSGKPTIDGKEITGNVTTDGLMYKRILTSNDDMDKLFEDGVYVYSTSSLPKNAPFSNAAVVEVFGARSTTTQKIQRAYRYGEAGHSAFRPLYAGTWGEWSYPAIISEKTVTGTTSAEGNLSLGLSLDDYVVLSVYCVAGNTAHICIPYRSTTSSEWAVKVAHRQTLEPLPSTAVTVTCFYAKRY